MTTRQKLIDRLHQTYPELSPQDIYELVLKCFDNIGEELSKGNRIEVRGFGALDVTKRKVVSPFKHATKTMYERKVVQYKMSKNILEEIN